MSKFSTNSGSSDDRATAQRPAIELARIHSRAAAWAAFWLIMSALVLIATALGLATITTGTLILIGFAEALAYFIGVLLHAAVGMSCHFWAEGNHTAERTLARIGKGLFFFFSLALIWLAVARYDSLVTMGRSPMGAFGITIFLLLLEIGVPAAFGLLFSMTWRQFASKNAEKAYFQRHKHLICTASKPKDRWTDAISKQRNAIKVLAERIRRADTEDVRRLELAQKVETGRLELLREWHPDFGYDEFDKPQVPAIIDPSGIESQSVLNGHLQSREDDRKVPADPS